MTGTDRIKAKILEEAHATANGAMDAARAEAERMLSAARSQADSILKDASARTAVEADALKKRMVSIAELEGRKDLLKARQETIAQAYETALKKLTELDDASSRKLLAPLVAQAAGREGGVLVLNTKDAARFGSDLTADANRLLDGAAQVTLGSETVAINGGFILKRGEMEINSSFDILLAQIRPTIEGDIVSILFGRSGSGGNV